MVHWLKISVSVFPTCLFHFRLKTSSGMKTNKTKDCGWSMWIWAYVSVHLCHWYIGNARFVPAYLSDVLGHILPTKQIRPNLLQFIVSIFIFNKLYLENHLTTPFLFKFIKSLFNNDWIICWFNVKFKLLFWNFKCVLFSLFVKN